ncbi:MAG: chromosome segregation protein SMC [Candidatus Limnocylindrales bacterium]
MTAPARLLSVRLQGFKSFAERTQVTFGPGISAVVGPNGSGKSNLADALRWSLGEQGRALRSRKSEDVIWAGSERRSAVGMADVQLTLDNSDGMLPVDYSVVELGRRLYRSGENEYLLNRQRVRLRDLVDLLDSAHLAENAFLFIGQGMVDQALALRPEERRPLFVEVAGVRRHQRRRRRAEEQLTESEANLARVEDIVAELRPQVRRLAVQAEQSASRDSAGDELVMAILAAAHARWHDAAARIADVALAIATGRVEVDAAFAHLADLEAAATAAATALEERARSGAELRRIADEARGALTSAQLEEGRLVAERAALARDRERIGLERSTAETDLGIQRRRLAAPVPERDASLEAARGDADRDLTAALAELAVLQAANRERDADVGALRRATTARAAEAEGARRRLTDAERRLAEEETRGATASERTTDARAAQAAADATLSETSERERDAAVAREAAAVAWEHAAALGVTATERAGAAAARVAAARSRLESAGAAIEDDIESGFASTMRTRGARRLDDGLVVDPGLGAAIDAALAGAGRAYLTKRDALREHGHERGLAVVVDEPVDGAAGGADGSRTDAAFTRRVAELGGGWLRDAVRRDLSGAAGRLLARAVWVPDLGAALSLQSILPAGWVAVVRDGSAVVGEVTVRLGLADGTLVRRAAFERATEELRAATQGHETAEKESQAAASRMAESRTELDTAQRAEAAAAGDRRAAEEGERMAARRLEALVRESAWQDAQVVRLRQEVELARAAIPVEPEAVRPAGEPIERQAIATWEQRVDELRTHRDRIAAQVAQVDATRRDAERIRAGAEAAIALDESRLAVADLAVATLSERERALAIEREALATRLAEAVVREAEARAALAALVAADAEERARLSTADRATAVARERLRSAEEASRTAEHRDLEARLGLESLREQLLVELAGLGSLSLRHLRSVAGAVEDAAEPDAEDEGEQLGAALVTAGEIWSASEPPEVVAAPGRLATLRRRYHELGAANPFAVDEFATMRARLEELESQQADLRSAIERTRSLITELDTMISEQFRTTFAALETRFDARFQQLFGGGFARLSLTDPTDLSSTGIEIVARPPGKKAQALAMLSGGERALTAVALLFAMLEVRPVPFCVLDEVDAALDEANIGRFTDALRELADTTQFVVITHNRGTIEIADALYGVTAGDDSVSRVISLRLDEATELADQARTSGAASEGATSG